jgi:hypothetical protein
MSAEDVHNILEPLLWATGLAVICFAAATLALYLHGRRMKADEGAE